MPGTRRCYTYVKPVAERSRYDRATRTRGLYIAKRRRVGGAPMSKKSRGVSPTCLPTCRRDARQQPMRKSDRKMKIAASSSPRRRFTARDGCVRMSTLSTRTWFTAPMRIFFLPDTFCDFSSMLLWDMVLGEFGSSKTAVGQIYDAFVIPRINSFW